jgi:hypothetical protein
MVDIVLWVLVLFQIINIPMSAYLIDRPRSPITSGSALFGIILNGIFGLALIAKLTQ